MIQRGAEVTDSEYDAILQYLSQHLLATVNVNTEATGRIAEILRSATRKPQRLCRSEPRKGHSRRGRMSPRFQASTGRSSKSARHASSSSDRGRRRRQRVQHEGPKPTATHGGCHAADCLRAGRRPHRVDSRNRDREHSSHSSECSRSRFLMDHRASRDASSLNSCCLPGSLRASPFASVLRGESSPLSSSPPQTLFPGVTVTAR